MSAARWRTITSNANLDDVLWSRKPREAESIRYVSLRDSLVDDCIDWVGGEAVDYHHCFISTTNAPEHPKSIALPQQRVTSGAHGYHPEVYLVCVIYDKNSLAYIRILNRSGSI